MNKEKQRGREGYVGPMTEKVIKMEGWGYR
jgi:hypothetical protein